jgi:transposase
LAEQIGRDGFRVLAAVTAPEAPGWLREVPAVETLRQVWLQQYHAPTDGVRWRGSADLPPAGRLINSPYAVEARYSIKRDVHWVGYQAHLTEVCEPDAPHFLTHVESTPGTMVDVKVLPRIHAALAAKQCLPREHLVDAGYVASETLVSSAHTHGIRVIGPLLPDSTWQARAGQGFDIAGFTCDWEARRATCPRGRPSSKWSVTHDRHGSEIINIRFARDDCQDCPSRGQCTTAPQGPREITVRPQAQHLALQAARHWQTTAEFQAAYNTRAGVEGTLAQGLRVAALRRARYSGLAKVRLQHVLTAAGLNLRRLGAWWEERPFAPTRQPRFAALLAASP